MKTTIVTASLDQKIDACTLYQEFIDETHAFQPKDLNKNFETYINAPTSHFILIYVDEIPAGFAEFRELPNKLRDESGIIEITSLYVRPQYRKLGLGKVLVMEVKRVAQAMNFVNIVLYSGLELENAHKFYEKIGFRKKAYYFSMSVIG